MTFDDIRNLIIDNEYFGCDEDMNTTASIDDLYDQLDDTVNTAYGVSKFVIIFKDKPSVVKIPFRGMYYQDYDSEGDNFVFDPFMIPDYCHLEASIYQDAVAAGISCFFAGTTFGGMTKNGVPYYVSEKAREWEWYENADIKISEKSMKTARKNYGRTCLPLEWLELAYEQYEEEKVNKLLNFLKEHGIQDFHYGNLGFKENGMVCILDYSDFDS